MLAAFYSPPNGFVLRIAFANVLPDACNYNGGDKIQNASTAIPAPILILP